MHRVIRKRDIAERFRDWNGREVILDKVTLTQHIARYHLDEVLVIGRLKAQFDRPRVVIENPGAHSENAIYDIPVGDHPCLLGL